MALPHGYVITPAVERFTSKVQIDKSGCHIWTGGTAGAGYGYFYTGETKPGEHGRVYAHRWAYERHVGPIPEGLQIDHLCRNRRCVNPEHLEAVTPRENYLRSNGNHRKTHCPSGHPYSTENTYRSPSGERFCRTCRGDSWRGCGWRSSLTECKHGHPFGPENTYIRPNGRRTCRECMREAKRRHRSKNKKEAA